MIHPAPGGMAAFERLTIMVLVAVASTSIEEAACAEGEPHASAELRYEREPGTESCPSETDLRASVAARLGYDPFVAKDGSDTISVRTRRKGTRIEGIIERSSRGRTNAGRPTTIASNATDCVELGSSLAVALAIAVDPLSLTRPPPPSAPPPAAAPAPEPAVAPPRNDPPAERPSSPAPPSEPPTRSRLLVAAGPSIAASVLPASPSFGARAALGMSRGMFEISVEGRFDPPVKVQDKVGAVEASLALATLVPCFHYRFAIGCALASIGGLRGTGLGFDHTREDNTFYAAAGARVGAELALGDLFAIRGLLEGHVPLRPTRLEADVALIWSTPAFAFAFVPMLVGRFP